MTASTSMRSVWSASPSWMHACYATTPSLRLKMDGWGCSTQARHQRFIELRLLPVDQVGAGSTGWIAGAGTTMAAPARRWCVLIDGSFEATLAPTLAISSGWISVDFARQLAVVARCRCAWTSGLQQGGKDDAAAIADAGDRRGHGAGVVTALKVSRLRAAPWRPLLFDAAAARVILLLERLLHGRERQAGCRSVEPVGQRLRTMASSTKSGSRSQASWVAKR